MSEKKDGDHDEGCEEKTCPVVKNVTHPLRYYELTPDEIRALEECDTESFYQRCVPLSAVLGSAAYALVKSGRLAANRVFGSGPKVLVGLALGWGLGRVANTPRCARRLRQLDSPLGDAMRQHEAASNGDTDNKSDKKK